MASLRLALWAAGQTVENSNCFQFGGTRMIAQLYLQFVKEGLTPTFTGPAVMLGVEGRKLPVMRVLLRQIDYPPTPMIPREAFNSHMLISRCQ